MGRKDAQKSPNHSKQSQFCPNHNMLYYMPPGDIPQVVFGEKREDQKIFILRHIPANFTLHKSYTMRQRATVTAPILQRPPPFAGSGIRSQTSARLHGHNISSRRRCLSWTIKKSMRALWVRSTGLYPFWTSARLKSLCAEKHGAYFSPPCRPQKSATYRNKQIW